MLPRGGALLSRGGALLPGAANFIVEEIPAYAPSGAGEHVHMRVEKTGLTTDAVAAALCSALGVSRRDVGLAGRKDRHAVARQFFSVRSAAASDDVRARCDAAGARFGSSGGEFKVLAAMRHGNKLQLGHLKGNRFDLGVRLAPGQGAAALSAAALQLAESGVANTFGPQRFGVAGSLLALAIAWGRGDVHRACALALDPTGRSAPAAAAAAHSPRRPEPEAALARALRRGASPSRALAESHALRALAASACQAALFNAIVQARSAAGLLYTLRPGDIACTRRGAPFVVRADELAEVQSRVARGAGFDLRTTGPLVGKSSLNPWQAIAQEEQAWAAQQAPDVRWDWLAAGGLFESHGERRPLLVPFLEPPHIVTLQDEPQLARIRFALPPGAYATTVLAELGVDVPRDRAGR